MFLPTNSGEPGAERSNEANRYLYTLLDGGANLQENNASERHCKPWLSATNRSSIGQTVLHCEIHSLSEHIDALVPQLGTFVHGLWHGYSLCTTGSRGGHAKLFLRFRCCTHSTRMPDCS